jgi:hypothetical protein
MNHVIKLFDFIIKSDIDQYDVIAINECNTNIQLGFLIFNYFKDLLESYYIKLNKSDKLKAHIYLPIELSANISELKGTMIINKIDIFESVICNIQNINNFKIRIYELYGKCVQDHIYEQIICHTINIKNKELIIESSKFNECILGYIRNTKSYYEIKEYDTVIRISRNFITFIKNIRQNTNTILICDILIDHIPFVMIDLPEHKNITENNNKLNDMVNIDYKTKKIILETPIEDHKLHKYVTEKDNIFDRLMIFKRFDILEQKYDRSYFEINYINKTVTELINFINKNKNTKNKSIISDILDYYTNMINKIDNVKIHPIIKFYL